jgi:hypothetical protein
VPVLVRTSYFPNWQASGADGPYRVSPNLMVVVPTGTHVELSYGWTGVDIGSYAVSAMGIAGAFLLARRPLRRLAGDDDSLFLDGPDPIIPPRDDDGDDDDVDTEKLEAARRSLGLDDDADEGEPVEVVAGHDDVAEWDEPDWEDDAPEQGDDWDEPGWEGDEPRAERGDDGPAPIA